jgi:hypothetical protein
LTNVWQAHGDHEQGRGPLASGVNMMMSMGRAAAVLSLVLVALMGVGCNSKRMGVYNIVVTPHSSLQDSSGKLSQVEVAIVGVKPDEAKTWNEHKVEQFFSGADPVRSGAEGYTRTMIFNANNPGPQSISPKDPIWKVWRNRGVMSIVVFANSKNLRVSPGGPDLRRRELPLTTDRWKVDQIDLLIKSSGIDCPTPMEVPN